MRPPAPCSTSSFPPPEQWQEITVAEARDLIRRVFCRWGLPERVRIDNGHPWGSAGDLPPQPALGLGGAGGVAGGAGARARLEPRPPTLAQSQGRAEQRRAPAMGRARRLPRPRDLEGTT